jgi:ATP-binding cassette subfamily B protein
LADRKSHPLELLRPYAHRYRGVVAAGIALVVLTNVLTPLVPLAVKYGLDVLDRGGPDPSWAVGPIQALGWSSPQGRLGFFALLSLVVTLLAGAFRFGMRYVITGASRSFERDLRDDLVAHLMDLPRKFFDHSRTGELMARLTNDLEAVRMMVGPALMYLSSTLVNLVVSLGLMLRISVALTLYSLIPLALIAVAARVLSHQIHVRSEAVQAQFGALSTHVQETLAGIRVVQAYTQERAEARTFERLNRDNIAANMALTRVVGLFMPLLIAFVNLGQLLILWIGGHRIVGGAMSLGDFVAFSLLLNILIWPMVALGWVVSLYQRGMASLGRIGAVLEQPRRADRAAGQGAAALVGALRIRDLTFAYNGHPVLRGLEVEIPAGSTAAIVGPTGSGKSTLLNLVARAYEAPAGALLIDGRPLVESPRRELARALGYVPQETFLFSDTLRANLLFGVDQASDQAIAAALAAAQLEGDLAGFPQGLETFVGERGITLSGGQKQRVAIARALLMDPKILLLDDALASVDTHTEEEILRHLQRARRGRTTLIVSHRVSTVRHADQIVVLVDGAIAERGSHDQLVAQGGVYAGLYRRQQLEDELVQS